MSTTVLRDDLDCLMKGACFLASGGGGPLKLAKEIKEEILKGPNPIEMVDMEDVKADDALCMVAGVGSPTAEAKFENSPLSALDALKPAAKKRFQYVIPIETGAVNSLIPLLVVTRSKERVRLVNADGGGRSFPQLKMSTFALSKFYHSKISCNPAVVAVEDLKAPPRILYIDDPDVLEEEIRGGSGPSALATFSMTGDQVKTPGSCVPSALRNAIDVGDALKLATHEARITQIEKILKRKVTPLMSKGKIKKLCLISDPSYEVGTVTLSEEGPSHTLHTITIFFVNENIAIQVDRQPPVMAPDMFCYLTTDGAPFTNAELVKDWDRWQNVEITLTQIEPAAELNRPEEFGYFKDLYDKYFGNLS